MAGKPKKLVKASGTTDEAAPMADSGFLKDLPVLRAVPLIPGKRIIQGSSGVARTTLADEFWNQFGGLLVRASEQIGCDVGSIIAIVMAESSGKVVDPLTRKMVIRFEVHHFWKRWGSQGHEEEFHKHFSFGEPSWKGHQFRPDNGLPFASSFHGNQVREWEVLNFAASQPEAEAAAYESTSAGLGQIMGFNAEKIGYGSAKEMFEAMEADPRFQILGILDFAGKRGLDLIQNGDFTGFASLYNGPGQAPQYGSVIQRYYRTWQMLSNEFGVPA